jgi:SAM-dependent methyltransferase
VKKLHLGCGSHKIEGWENHDMDVDLRAWLPFENDSVDFIFSEHVVEHLRPFEAWHYFEECFRILKRGGVVRTTVPDITQVWTKKDPEYAAFVAQRGWGDGSQKSSIQHLVFNHGHQSLWTPSLLATVQAAIGFLVVYARPYHSDFEPLSNLEQHGIDLGKENNLIESISTDALKS